MYNTTFYNQGGYDAEDTSPDVPRKGKKPTFDPSVDTRLITFYTKGDEGRETALNLLDDLYKDRILHIEKDELITKKSSTCYTFYKSSLPNVFYETNESIVKDKLKFRRYKGKSNNLAFRDMAAQIDLKIDDREYELSIHVCKYNCDVEQRRAENRKRLSEREKLRKKTIKESSIKIKNNNEKFFKVKEENAQDEVIEVPMETDKDHLDYIEPTPVDELDGSCWYYLTGGNKKITLPLNIVRPSTSSTDMKLYHSTDMQQYPLLDALAPLKMDEDGNVTSISDPDGFVEMILVNNNKRNKTFYVKVDELDTMSSACTYKVVPNKKTESNGGLSSRSSSYGARLYITDNSVAPSCFKVLVGVCKKYGKSKKPKFAVTSETIQNEDSKTCQQVVNMNVDVKNEDKGGKKSGNEEHYEIIPNQNSSSKLSVKIKKTAPNKRKKNCALSDSSDDDDDDDDAKSMPPPSKRYKKILRIFEDSE